MEHRAKDETVRGGPKIIPSPTLIPVRIVANYTNSRKGCIA